MEPTAFPTWGGHSTTEPLLWPTNLWNGHNTECLNPTLEQIIKLAQIQILIVCVVCANINMVNLTLDRYTN